MINRRKAKQNKTLLELHHLTPIVPEVCFSIQAEEQPATETEGSCSDAFRASTTHQVWTDSPGHFQLCFLMITHFLLGAVG